MITTSRRQLRRLRVVFRRSALGIAHRGPIPPLVFAIEDGQLCVRHRYAALGIEHAEPSDSSSHGPVALPLDALADLEGKDDSAVIFDQVAPDRTVARWVEHGIPRSRDYAVPAIATLPPFPAMPADWSDVAADLLDALADASAIADEDGPRYALGCLLLKRGHDGHEVVATDGRQMLIRGGFRLPWDGDVLVRRSPIFASRGLPRDRPWSIGRTGTHVTLRCRPWTIATEIAAGVRFPRVDLVFPTPDAATARLRIDPADAAALIDALGRLPGSEAGTPVTVDLNGKVAVRSRGDGDAHPTELVLSRSSYGGTPVRFPSARGPLARALRLGFREVEVVDPSTPIVCRDGVRAFAWQPLDAFSAIAPADDAVRIESDPHPVGPPAPPDAATPSRPTMTDRIDPPRSDGPAEAGGRTPPEAQPPTGLAALIADAEALHDALCDARARAGRLVAALRKQRRRDRLVQATLASLRQLKLQEAAE